MSQTRFRLAIAALIGVASAAVPGFSFDLDQAPLRPASSGLSSDRSSKCDLPPAIDPSSDGLPSADDLFSSDEALEQHLRKLQDIVRVPSVCFDDLGEFDQDERWQPFHQLHEVLAALFPQIHDHALVEKVNTFGLVYTLQGSDDSLKPTLLAAHQDVVPVADESTWKHPPFDAHYDGEWLWGRGASDDKGSLVAIMSAVETLLVETDWVPRRTLILAFGFDEECSGYRGAKKIGEHLHERYGDDGLAVILDEGGLGLLPMDDILYALPAVMEKGHVDIWFELRTQGGHSSIPSPHTGIGIMAEMIAALEAHPYEPAVLKNTPVHSHLICQAQYSPDAIPGLGDLLDNDELDWIAGLLVYSSAFTTYMIQTSQAVDFIRGGLKINALPEVVTLGVNYRVAPQDSIPKVQHNVVKYIDDVVAKYNLSVSAFEGDEEYEGYVASLAPEDRVEPQWDFDYDGSLALTAGQKSAVTPASPTKGPVWDVFSGTIQHTFAFDNGTVVPAGEIMTGNTDTRHYLDLTPNIYRWTPLTPDVAANIHTVDERVLVSHQMTVVKFYYDFIRNFDAADL